jgi:alpha-D-ribose 1-methylphosphonate 5-triphosphate synthase subunit PhnL
MSAANVLAVRGLVKSFTLHTIDGRVVEALHGVDLDVAAAEHVALAGTSGAGKSSLLRCVYRTYLPTAGTVLLRTSTGRVVDLAALPDSEVADLRGRELGYVSQFLRSEPRRAVLDVVARAGVGRGMDARTARDAAAAALRRLGIEERLWAMHTTWCRRCPGAAALRAGRPNRPARRRDAPGPPR